MATPSTLPRPVRGAALMCDEAGDIAEIMLDDLGLLAGNPGSIAQLIEPSDRPKLEGLLKDAVALQPAFDRVMSVVLDSHTERLHFGAAFVNGHVLVLSARDRRSLAHLNQTFMPVIAGRMAQPGPGSPEQWPPKADEQRALYNDVSHLINELGAAERRLTKANLQLDRAHRELRALYDSLPIGIFRANAFGRIEQANDRFCSITGVSSPNTWLDRVHEEDAKTVESSWREAVLQGVAFESVHRRSNDGGAPRFIEMKAVSLRDASDNPAGLVGVVEDVSERISAGERRREFERLEAVRELTGGLAHHLNNIMMVILSSAEQLCEAFSPQAALGKVARGNLVASEQAALLTRRLIVYAGLGGLSSSGVEVDPAIEDICRELSKKLPHHALTASLGAPGAAIGITRILLAETLQALVANAQAAMPRGGIIHVATTPGAAETARGIVVISVTDSGVGMSEETIRRARDPFFTTRGIGGGIGLGLSLADGAARITGGTLEISSHAGTGTVIELRLPIIRSVSRPADPAGPPDAI